MKFSYDPKAAKALGLTVPRRRCSLRADEVIE